MGQHSYRSVTWKKKFCAVLIVSLFIEGICFRHGEVILSVQAMDGDREETEFGKDKEKSKSEMVKSEPEASEIRTSAQDTKEADLSTPSNSETETSAQGEEKTYIQESKETNDYGPKVPEPTSSYKVLPEERQSELEGLTCLQIPEKLKIIIDPWEIDEKGQIYSEPFVIKNTGNSPGILTLSFTCTLNRAEGVRISETEEDLYTSDKKLIYMKVVLGNGKDTVFTKEGAECQVRLQPTEEVSLRFEGKVNENAEKPWKDDDMEIKGTYSWKEEKGNEGEMENISYFLATPGVASSDKVIIQTEKTH